MTNKELEEGLLDDLGYSQRFVQPYKLEDSIKASQKNKQKIKTKSSKRIAHPYKYGKAKNNPLYKSELTTSDLIRIASGFQQAIVKVTSYGKGINKILRHITYISRNFDLPIEDQEQSLLLKHQDITELLATWNSIYFDHRKNSRDTVHIVFSAPPESCRESFKKLTREFLAEEFGGEHDYLFVPHNDTAHPHIHSVICMRSIEGKKLDPRKAYLNQLRKRFAEKCREHGIYVEASRRFESGLAGKSVKSELLQMRTKRQEMPVVDKRLIERVKQEIASNQPVYSPVEKIRQSRNAHFRNQFYKTAKSLYDHYMASPKAQRQDNEIQAAKLLLDFSKHFPTEVTRPEILKEKLITNKATLKSAPSDFLGLPHVGNMEVRIKKIDLEINGDEC